MEVARLLYGDGSQSKFSFIDHSSGNLGSVDRAVELAGKVTVAANTIVIVDAVADLVDPDGQSVSSTDVCPEHEVSDARPVP